MRFVSSSIYLRSNYFTVSDGPNMLNTMYIPRSKSVMAQAR